MFAVSFSLTVAGRFPSFNMKKLLEQPHPLASRSHNLVNEALVQAIDELQSVSAAHVHNLTALDHQKEYIHRLLSKKVVIFEKFLWLSEEVRQLDAGATSIGAGCIPTFPADATIADDGSSSRPHFHIGCELGWTACLPEPRLTTYFNYDDGSSKATYVVSLRVEWPSGSSTIAPFIEHVQLEYSNSGKASYKTVLNDHLVAVIGDCKRFDFEMSIALLDLLSLSVRKNSYYEDMEELDARVEELSSLIDSIVEVP